MAIAHARKLAEAHPKSAPARRRLGNLCNLYGLHDEAESAWRRAVELDETEAEAGFSLAVTLWEKQRWQDAIQFVQLTLARYPRAELKPGLREQMGEWLAGILEELAQMAEDPIALDVGYACGEVKGEPVMTLSSVDLRRVGDWERLGKLLGSGDVLPAQLTPVIPDRADGPTILEVLQQGKARPRWRPRWKPGRSSLSKKAKRRARASG